MGFNYGSCLTLLYVLLLQGTGLTATSDHVHKSKNQIKTQVFSFTDQILYLQTKFSSSFFNGNNLINSKDTKPASPMHHLFEHFNSGHNALLMSHKLESDDNENHLDGLYGSYINAIYNQSTFLPDDLLSGSDECTTDMKRIFSELTKGTMWALQSKCVRYMINTANTVISSV